MSVQNQFVLSQMGRFAVVFVFAVAALLVAEGSHNNREDKNMKYVTNLRKICKELHHPSPAAVSLIESFQPIPNATPNEKCYMGCLLTTNGQYTKLDSKGLRTNYRKYVEALFDPPVVNRALEIFEECARQSPTNDLENCDCSYNVTSCFTRCARNEGLQYRKDM